TAIWFFRVVGNEIHVIDFYENSGEGLRHYMTILKNKGYEYNKSGHYAPHDIMNKEFGSDAKSRYDLARDGYEIDGQKYSINFQVLPRGGIDDGIEQVREILGRCVFDERKCEEGIVSLESYRKEWDDKKGCWKDKPLHDHTSHAADAFRYLANSQTKTKIAKSTTLSWRR
ncbi:MAG: terminase, partial [Acinetobacter sp.]